MIAEMIKKSQSNNSSISRVVGYYLLGVVAGVMGIVAMTRLIWHSKFYPNVIVGNVDVSGMRREEAEEALKLAIAQTAVSLNYGGYEWLLPATALNINLEQSLNEAYRVGRRLDLTDYALIFVNKPQVYGLIHNEGTSELYNQLMTEIAQSVEIPVSPATVGLRLGKIEISNGSDGVHIDSASLASQISERVATLSQEPVQIPTQVVAAQLRTDQIEQLRERAETLATKELVLVFEDDRVRLAGSPLVAFLDTRPEPKLPFDQEVLNEYVLGLAESYNREPEDARFEYIDGQVTEFAPGRDGVEVNNQSTIANIQKKVEILLNEESKTETVEIVTARTPPSVTMDLLNELGIRERIGRGESYYVGSIANRAYNVALASERTNTALIPPGEEYSFNREVGEISGATGYKTAYVISGGRTVLGDGGGVCQVSTTLFRAAMNAGLPITERWAHAYRVGYYEQNSKPGIDATVYSPSKDLRFKNDTPGHILIQTINDPKKLHLVVEIYGTHDGRVATITEPKVSGVTPPPPDLYQDDPSLPAGQVKQVDWSAWGARTSFEYKVVRGEEVLQDKVFSSSYRPWQNVYLRGVGP